MSENREATYLELQWDEDFSVDAHVDSDGEQRFILTGYIYKRKADGLYRAPLLPQLFFGQDGTQLETWRQYLHAGDGVILSRDGGNPSIPDSELAWSKVSEAQPRQTQVQPIQPAQVVQRLEIPVFPILVLVGVPVGLYLLWKAVR